MKEIRLTQGELGLELYHSTANWILRDADGYSPVNMLVASIGACGAYVLESIALKSKIAFTLKEVVLHYDRHEDQKSRPLSHVIIDIYGESPVEQQERMRRYLGMVNDYCPVIQSLNSDVIIEKRITFI